MDDIKQLRHDGLLAEYNSLRTEIMQKIELRNTLLICVYTASTAFLGFALANDRRPGQAFLALLPILVVIPVSLRVGYYRNAIAKLSAYQMVFLVPELNGIGWELRNDSALKKVESGEFGGKLVARSRDWLNGVRYIDFPVICLICFLVFVYRGGLDEPFGWVFAIAAGVAAAFELAYIFRINRINDQKDTWYVRWERVREEERHHS